LSHNLFSFPIPTRPGDHPHPTGDFLSVSHSPWLQTSSNRPLPISHSPSLLDSLPLFPFPFPQQINKSLPPPPDSKHSWRDEGKNWFPIPSSFFYVKWWWLETKNDMGNGYAVKFTVYLLWNLTLTPMLCLILLALVLQIL
jgi:hypothetical protein